MEYIGISFYIVISYLVADRIGKHKSLGFWKTFALCLILSPFFGYLIAAGGGQKNAKGCNWCGNKYNEAEYCGLCGKNEKGDISPGFVSPQK